MNYKKIRTVSIDDIVAHIQTNHKSNKVFTLTTVLADNGYEIGIADEGESGYTETGLIIDDENYNNACDIVDKANEILFPDRSKKENMLIQLSTMRKAY